eukprot:2057546-Amphidinium_carterae.1
MSSLQPNSLKYKSLVRASCCHYEQLVNYQSGIDSMLVEVPSVDTSAADQLKFAVKRARESSGVICSKNWLETRPTRSKALGSDQHEGFA